MKRLAVGLSVMAVALSVLFTSAAVAAPSGFCGEDGTKPDHPRCVSTTSQPTSQQVCETAFIIAGPRYVYECEWTPQQGLTQLETGTVNATLDGEVSRLVIFVNT